jgi:hypothetical protein
MSVLARPLGVVVHRVVVHRDRRKAAAWASVRVRLGARNTSPMRRSSNVLAGTTRSRSQNDTDEGTGHREPLPTRRTLARLAELTGEPTNPAA